MIAATFGTSALLLFVTAGLFGAGYLSAQTQTAAWMCIFFFASAAASSAYLTASEIFPLEMLFSWLIESRSNWRLSAGYAFAALLLAIAAATEAKVGIDAEGKSLESIAKPLSSA
jgi:hypothetical protein